MGEEKCEGSQGEIHKLSCKDEEKGEKEKEDSQVSANA
jgi:hypothetical protein